MNSTKMAQIIASLSDQFKQQESIIQFVIGNTKLLCLFDEKHDRMRIMTAVGLEKALDSDVLLTLLRANFHSTLDARYAASKGIVYATFIHPLSSLSEAQLRSGIAQVLSLQRNYGTSYSSETLIFGGE